MIFTKIEVDNSISIWFLDNDESYQEYLTFQKEQGSDEILVLMIETENTYSKEHLKKLKTLIKIIDEGFLYSIDFFLICGMIINGKYNIFR